MSDKYLGTLSRCSRCLCEDNERSKGQFPYGLRRAKVSLPQWPLGSILGSSLSNTDSRVCGMNRDDQDASWVSHEVAGEQRGGPGLDPQSRLGPECWLSHFFNVCFGDSCIFSLQLAHL